MRVNEVIMIRIEGASEISVSSSKIWRVFAVPAGVVNPLSVRDIPGSLLAAETASPLENMTQNIAAAHANRKALCF